MRKEKLFLITVYYTCADDTVALSEGHIWEEAYRNAKHMAVSLRATHDPGGLELRMHNGQCNGPPDPPSMP
ncbi:hypothetical protein J6590_082845 [Homalodisca vitripennis]|nr:hypothetical protein J6590_082845 [Homalodisca vitripennis]